MYLNKLHQDVQSKLETIAPSAQGISWERWWLGNGEPPTIWENGKRVPNPKYDMGEASRMIRSVRREMLGRIPKPKPPVIDPIPEENRQRKLAS